ncbi:MAG: CIA30 family protein, partial [Bacteroidales bacterium]|nr:CIA30 family protein [Bacteroidales bacterium]
MILFDFKSDSDISNWRVVDDVVMGGQSNGSFFINNEGHGVFQGKVSLDNNGGFSSVQYRFNAIHVKEKKKIFIRIKGDGKRYQIRIKSNRFDNHSYIYYFETSGDWQNIEISLT